MELLRLFVHPNSKIMFIPIIMLATLSVACQTSDPVSASPPKGPFENAVEPVDVVKQFWIAALEGKQEAGKRFITNTPHSFYDSDCPDTRTEKPAGPDEYNATRPTTAGTDSLTGSMMKTFDNIGRKKLRLDKVTLKRAKGDEALVELIYYDATDNITVHTFALLHRQEDAWKAFLVASNPEIINPNYAAERCK